MVVFGQNLFYSEKVVVFGLKRMYSGNSCCIYSSKSGCIWGLMVVFGQNGCIQAKWLYSGKGACIRVRWL